MLKRLHSWVIARQVLEGRVLPGNLAILRSLTNPSRRFVRRRDPLPDSVVEHRDNIFFGCVTFLEQSEVFEEGSCWRVVRDDLRTFTPSSREAK